MWGFCSEGSLAFFYQIWVGGVHRKERTLHGRLACCHGFCWEANVYAYNHKLFCNKNKGKAFMAA